MRLYIEKEVIYTFMTDYKLYSVVWGSFAREDNCLILLYENAGFEVLILHRQFNPKERYGSNRAPRIEYDALPIPKKTNHFLTYWQDEQDEASLYRYFEKSLSLLKWRTLREKYSDRKQQAGLEIGSKVLGLGPIFTIQL